MLGKSASVGEVARTKGLTRQTVYRIRMIRQWLKPLLPPGECTSGAPGSSPNRWVTFNVPSHQSTIPSTGSTALRKLALWRSR
jgi:hypothetical protein